MKIVSHFEFGPQQHIDTDLLCHNSLAIFSIAVEKIALHLEMARTLVHGGIELVLLFFEVKADDILRGYRILRTHQPRMLLV